MDSSNLFGGTNGLFIACNVIAVLLALVRLYLWARGNPPTDAAEHAARTTKLIIRFFDYGIRCWGDIMFLYLLIMTGYWFVTFKMQNSVKFLIPDLNDGQYTNFKIVFAIVCIFQFITMIQVIRSQNNIDIFFIDWVYNLYQNANKYRKSHKFTSKRLIGLNLSISQLGECSSLLMSSTRGRSLDLLIWNGFILYLVCLCWVSSGRRQPL